MEKIDLNKLKNRAEREIKAANNLRQLDGLFKQYLGENGQISRILSSLKKMPAEERAKTGKEANNLKRFLREAFEKRINKVKEEEEEYNEKREGIDITIPGKKPLLGHLHPLTMVKRRVEDIFQSMGFSVVEGPEIENEHYNFDALNIPPDHPARDMWDTLWIKSLAKRRFLLRTHTSPVQARYMESHNPPLRIIVPGNVFRHEATDIRHEFQLSQVEGLMVDRHISVANLKAVLSEFFKRFFGENTRFRLEPDFFPFTEPSFNVSITCVICGGKGCNLCKRTGWLEVAGAGMVHPNVFRNCGLDPREWQGWAFGFGLDRLAMMKYRIDDVRLFRSGDLRFLNQF